MTASSRKASHFPSHNEPRVWFITSASSPIGLAIAYEALNHGDYVVAGHDVRRAIDDGQTHLDVAGLVDHAEHEGRREKLRIVKVDAKYGGRFV